jgi:glycine cleavage system regulatory protein
MQIPLVMTVLGKDRTGLVESIARLVAEHGGNWLESRMCRLGGEFAGILRVHIPAEKRAALEQALAKLNDLSIVVRSDEAPRAAGESHLATLEVVGPDRPGIVREITHALAAQGVNVEELSTECVSAPMSGEALFQASAMLLLPAGVSVSALRQALEQAVTGLTVEVTLAELK